jgi:CubicO group peptidase (beta-lactamase class C family)
MASLLGLHTPWDANHRPKDVILKPQGRTAFAAIFLLALAACGGGGGGGSGATTTSPVVAANDAGKQVPPNDTDKWDLVAAAQVEMDPVLLARASSDLPSAKEHGMDSMLVMRHGKPVLENYWNGFNKDTLHDLRSATKSITSLMLGIAIDKQMVGGVADQLSSYLGPLYPAAPALKQGITLESMLTMRSGLDCDDWVDSSAGNESKMYLQTDWVKFYLNLPSVMAPDTETHYCTGNPVALGRVINLASKRSIPDFANEFLFAPMDIKAAIWADFDEHRQTDTGGHLRLRPRDMMKIGQLALQNGVWNNTGLVSSAWITQSTSKQTTFEFPGLSKGYGYFWWRSNRYVNGKPYEMYYADGNGGQYIFVVPAFDLVAVFTGSNYNSDNANRPFSIMDNYILAAAK